MLKTPRCSKESLVIRVLSDAKTSAVAVTLIFILWHPQVWAGGGRFNVRGLGMGRTFVATARGIDAVGLNPANLAFRDRNRNFTFGILPFGVTAASSFINYGSYKKYFTGVESTLGSERDNFLLRDQDKQDILSQFGEGIGHLNLNAEVRWFGLTYTHNLVGGIGITITDLLAANADIPQDYARFALYGLPPEGATYELSATDFRAWWLREYSLSYAREFPRFKYFNKVSVGASIKLVHGYAYFETERYNGPISNIDPLAGPGRALRGEFEFRTRRSGTSYLADVLSDDSVRSEDASFQFMPAPAGTGIGFDVGVSADLLPWLTGGASLTDIGTITWKRNLRETSASMSIDLDNPFTSEQEDSLEKAFRGETRRLAGEISSPLPTAFRLGMAVQVHDLVGGRFFGELIVAADYHQGFNDSPGNSKRARISFGAEYRPIGFLPLRTGLSFGGLVGSFWAVGFGFDFGVFSMDFASESGRFLIGSDSTSKLSLAFGMKLRF